MKAHHALILGCLLVSIVASAGRGVRHACSPSSCGEQQRIRYPFRLQDDPPNCGDPRYELICENNRTILDYHSGKYYVDSISYENNTIRVTDVSLASGQCTLPSQSLSPKTLDHDEVLGSGYAWDSYFSDEVVSFVNCTQRIQNKTYTAIPCLSGDSGFVYVVYDSSIESLAPSCRFLAMIPSTGSANSVAEFFVHKVTMNGSANKGVEIFEHLQKGFFLRWSNASCPTVLSQFKFCLQPAQRHQGFYPCLEEAYLTPCNSNYSPVVGVIISIVLLYVVFIGLMFARFVCVPLAVYTFLAKKYHETRVPMNIVEKFLRNQQSLAPTRYTYADIIFMTRYFKEKLGQGGFGSVYKGELLGGIQVAVKILDKSKYSGDDFISEVSTIGTINHINVVRLVGYSSEGSNRALVYEFLPKGSLDKYIFSSNGTIQRPFTWEKLNDIALGVARGIDYLHRGCDMRILHFDIKPHNILLDNRFNPKVSDFGLAKLCPKDFSIVAVSAARGTIGYIAPEQISRSFGAISYKSDVYSFGMLLMEMAGGRRNVEPKAENTSQIYYPSWIYDQLDEQMGVHCPIVKDLTGVGDIEKKLSIVGLWCIQTRPSERPSMSRVVEMLQAEVDTLQMPPKPFHSAETVSSTSITDQSMTSSSAAYSVISEGDSFA